MALRRLPWAKGLTAALCAMAMVVTVWGASAQAGARSGGPLYCSDGALVETRGHASGSTIFRHYQGKSYRGVTVAMGAGSHYTYRSGYTNIHNSISPLEASRVFNDWDEHVWSARSTCGPPA